MKKLTQLEKVIELCPDEEFLKADGWDDCIIGVTTRGVLVYNRNKIIDMLMKDKLSREEAEEYFEFNIECAYVGDKTPIYIDVIDEVYFEEENVKLKWTKNIPNKTGIYWWTKGKKQSQ